MRFERTDVIVMAVFISAGAAFLWFVGLPLGELLFFSHEEKERASLVISGTEKIGRVVEGIDSEGQFHRDETLVLEYVTVRNKKGEDWRFHSHSMFVDMKKIWQDLRLDSIVECDHEKSISTIRPGVLLLGAFQNCRLVETSK